MTRSRFIAALLTCLSLHVFALEAQDREALGSNLHPDPMFLLAEAYHASKNFDEYDQATILAFMAESVAPMSTENAQDWAIHSFRLSRAINSGTQINSLITLSEIDPESVVKLLAEYETRRIPVPYQGIQCSLSGPLFSALWARHGLDSLDEINQLAKTLGTNRYYPYNAVGDLLPRIHSRDKASVRRIYSNAMDFFDFDSSSYSDYHMLVDFILNTYNLIPKGELQAHLNSLVNSLLKLVEPKLANPILIKMRLKHRTLEFASERDLLIYRLLPLLRYASEASAESMLRDNMHLASYPVLDLRDDYGYGMVRLGESVDSEDKNRATFDYFLLEEVEEKAEEMEPGEVLTLIDQIITPHIRQRALATILAKDLRSDLAEPKSILLDIQNGLASMKPSIVKLQLQVDLARAYLSRGLFDQGLELLSRALDLGLELYRIDQMENPTKPTNSTLAFDELLEVSSLMGRMVEYQPRNRLEWIRRIHSDVLKSYVLVFFAKGLIEVKGQRL